MNTALAILVLVLIAVGIALLGVLLVSMAITGVECLMGLLEEE